MKHAFALAFRHLAHEGARSALIIAALALVLALPLGLRGAVDAAAGAMLDRAEGTQLIIGARGSELDLVVASLYFARPIPRSFAVAARERCGDSDALVVPLHLGLSAQAHPLIGTELEYFELRNLTFAEGRPFVMLGECVLGASVARALPVAGDPIITDARDPYDLAGTIPLRLRPVGTLAPTGTPDDEAIFVDLATAWTVIGLGHGHRSAAAVTDPNDLIGRVGDHVVAAEALRHYEEITPETVEDFHFHGDPETFPIHALLLRPADQREGALLQARFHGSDDPLQILRPRDALERLLREILGLRRLVEAALLTGALVTIGVVGVVIGLSIRLRREELATLVRIGAARGTVARIIAAEVILIALAATTLAGAGILVARQLDAPVERLLLGR